MSAALWTARDPRARGVFALVLSVALLGGSPLRAAVILPLALALAQVVLARPARIRLLRAVLLLWLLTILANIELDRGRNNQALDWAQKAIAANPRVRARAAEPQQFQGQLHPRFGADAALASVGPLAAPLARA